MNDKECHVSKDPIMVQLHLDFIDINYGTLMQAIIELPICSWFLVVLKNFLLQKNIAFFLAVGVIFHHMTVGHSQHRFYCTCYMV